MAKGGKRMTKERLFEKLDAEVERWNRDHPIGTWVKRDGVVFGPTITRAFMKCGRPTVFVDAGNGSTFLELSEIEPCS